MNRRARRRKVSEKQLMRGGRGSGWADGVRCYTETSETTSMRIDKRTSSCRGKQWPGRVATSEERGLLAT